MSTTVSVEEEHKARFHQEAWNLLSVVTDEIPCKDEELCWREGLSIYVY